jgi:predicted phosphodiesterase
MKGRLAMAPARRVAVCAPSLTHLVVRSLSARLRSLRLRSNTSRTARRFNDRDCREAFRVTRSSSSRRPRQSRRAGGRAQAIRAEKPDLVAIAGDHALNGPDPAGTIDLLRQMEGDGAAIVSGNTDIAVADFDFAAAFPWLLDGVPEAFQAAAEWAHDALGDERVSWLRRLPSERRLRADDGTMILVCHASPGSQTAGFDQALEASVVTERVSRTDARVIVCGHTHLPETATAG